MMSIRPGSAARGLSGGGLRTVYLAGLDDRIRCACCVGMMSTWRDYLLNKCHTHTWMVYIPGIPRDLDYPEILGLAFPWPRWSRTTSRTTSSRSTRCGGPIACLGGLRQGRRERPLQVLVLPWPAQVRPAPCKMRHSPGSIGG